MHLLGLILLLVSLADQTFGSEERPTIEDLTFATKLIENKRFVLNCLLSAGTQDVSVEWFLNGQKVIPNENVYVSQHEESSMLNIRSMGIELAGEFECRVFNRFGKDSRSISVKLEGKNGLKSSHFLWINFQISNPEFFSQAQVSHRTDRHPDETEHSVFNQMPNNRTACTYNQMGKTVI